MFALLDLPETWGLFLACSIPGVIIAAILIWALCRMAADCDDQDGTR